MKLVAAGNIVVPAYLIIKEMGYIITVKDLSDKEQQWSAAKDGNEFIASDPVQVLALIKLYEVRGKSWQASDLEVDEFLQKYA